VISTHPSPDPSIVLGLCALLGLRVWLVRASGSAGQSADTGVRQSSYIAGLATIFVALASPLHDLAEQSLFSAHMVQHLLLTLVAPPLLLFGLPSASLQAALRHARARSVMTRLGNPVVGLLASTATLAVWHVPALYDLAVAQHNVHIFEHLTLMATASLFWWPIAAPLPPEFRLHDIAAMAYLFVGSLPGAALGALLTFAPDVLYRSYIGPDPSGLRTWLGMNPLTDQQLGGLLMWIPGGLIYWTVLGVILVRQLTDQPPASVAHSRTEMRSMDR
jgi:cytochrome c oxidase assembly factor CtaG